MIYSSIQKFNLKLVIFTILILFHLQTINGYKLLNCYSSLPSSFSKDNTNEFQSSSLCHTTCSGKGHKYFALANHSDCYCGDSSPAGLTTSTSCNTNCYGYGQEMCGGTSSFSIYTENDSETVNDDDTNSSANNNNDATSATTNPTNTRASKKPTASALGMGTNGGSQIVVTAQTTSNIDDTSTVVSEQDVVATSVVYSTELQTQGGSTIFVTNTITKSTQAMPTGNVTNTNDRTDANNKKKKTNVGAIVGGVVGGVCGAIVVAVIILLGLRHYNMKREEDRMEKEYQEAIKPVEYVPNDILSSSSHSYSFDGGNTNGKLGHDVMNDSIGMTTLPTNNLMDSNSNSSNNNSSYNNNLNSNNNNNYNIPRNNSNNSMNPSNLNNNNNNNNNNLMVANPFDDSRRISTGSIMTEDPDPNKPTKLTIVNPDE
ncbi:protein Slg1p [Monosporozyma unispora]|nr:hypothetical protein C6P44_001538 [Kazachstania unispora]